MSDLISVIQTIVKNTIKGMHMADMATGIVESSSPLSIKLDISMAPIPSEAIVLTDAVKERYADVIGGSGGRVQLSRSLKNGDKVLMLRVSGGQRFIVLSII